VYLGGSHQYSEIYGTSNGRGVVMSSDAGESFTDMTVEAETDGAAINLHPDHHYLVTHPGNPYVFFEGSDGGVVRSNGAFSDASATCATRGLSGSQLVACQRLLSRIPARLTSLNKGFSTLQFQSLSVDPRDSRNLIGGTQDNGTWQNNGSSDVWEQSIYGDGGQSGFDAANPSFRFNTFFTQATDANFQNGDPTKWVVISGPLMNSGEPAAFYIPIISDPSVGGTMFAGMQSVWRTKKNGGDQAYLEANCPEFTTSAANPNCGDWVRLGTGLLTAAGLGDRSGGTMAAIERVKSDTSTLWTATSTGRVFVSKNADAETASEVGFTRIDSLASNDPGRFVSSLYVDPANANRAWISYSGYSALTPATPGHVFEVVFDPEAGTATWTNLDGGTGPMGDLPVTDLVRDDVTGDLYAATDFGVLRLASGTTAWTTAGAGLPAVEVAGLTIVPESRILYAATHGRSAWRLALP
ncbi:MAG: Glycosyl hydrolase, BNR repeat precursor, partial [uncultured Chloroflexia bacterium]